MAVGKAGKGKRRRRGGGTGVQTLKRRRRMEKANKVIVKRADGTTQVLSPSKFKTRAKAKGPKQPMRNTEFHKRLAALGYESYGAYLRSAHWRSIKKRYARSGMPKDCYICNQRGSELHHRTYKRLGDEHLTDLVALCQPCHADVHNWVRARGNTPDALMVGADELRQARKARSRQSRTT